MTLAAIGLAFALAGIYCARRGALVPGCVLAVLGVLFCIAALTGHL